MSAACPDCGATVDTVDDFLEHLEQKCPGKGTYHSAGIDPQHAQRLEEFRRRVDEWSTRDDVQAAAITVDYVFHRVRAQTRNEPVP